MKYYTKLRELLTLTGISFECGGAAEHNLGQQVFISISDEQGLRPAITLIYDISLDGTETFVCQE